MSTAHRKRKMRAGWKLVIINFICVITGERTVYKRAGLPPKSQHLINSEIQVL